MNKRSNENPEREGTMLSRMPQDAAYWDGLATRVETRAAPVLARYASGASGEASSGASGRTGGVFGWIGDRSPALAAGALAAAALAWLFVPPAASVGPPTVLGFDAAVAPPSTVARALTPSDPLVAQLMTDPVPPTIGSLVARPRPGTRP